jgi:hypothetical protein
VGEQEDDAAADEDGAEDAEERDDQAGAARALVGRVVVAQPLRRFLAEDAAGDQLGKLVAQPADVRRVEQGRVLPQRSGAS